MIFGESAKLFVNVVAVLKLINELIVLVVVLVEVCIDGNVELVPVTAELIPVLVVPICMLLVVVEIDVAEIVESEVVLAFVVV